jgi:hypothetical protein
VPLAPLQSHHAWLGWSGLHPRLRNANRLKTTVFNSVALYRKVRRVDLIALSVVGSALVLQVPASAISIRVSPIGAPLMIALFIALGLPSALGFGLSRGLPAQESVAARHIRRYDAVLVASSVFGFLALGAVGAQVSARFNAADVGDTYLIATRALMTYLGWLLVARFFVGWRAASVAPALYLLAVGVFGFADETAAAGWAWIGLPANVGWAWACTWILLGLGAALWAWRPNW